MLAIGSHAIRTANILIFSLLVIWIFEFSFVTSGFAQTGGPIMAAPGQPVKEDITLGEPSPEDISITLPAFGPLAMDPMSSPCIVSSSTPLVIDSMNPSASGWGISVSSNTTGGYMAEYNSSASQYIPDGRKLQTPMKITAEGGNEVDLSKGGTLIQEDGTGTSMSIPLSLRQDVLWEDTPLPSGRIYHIEISFIASALY